MKTAEDLGIPQWVYDRLLDVRDNLAAGKFVHEEHWEWYNPDRYGYEEYKDKLPSMGFNMEIGSQRAEDCGTACCIGGWVYALEHGVPTEKDGKVIYHYNDDRASDFVYSAQDPDNEDFGAGHSQLGSLFFPPASYDYKKIKPEHAVKAIQNYFESGRPKWADFLPSSIKNNDE